MVENERERPTAAAVDCQDLRYVRAVARRVKAHVNQYCPALLREKRKALSCNPNFVDVPGKTALVLSAGGMFGAYQAGVWDALSK